MSSLENESVNKNKKLKPEDYCVEFRVLARIYEYIRIKKKSIWFSRLVNCFNGKIPKAKISKAEDKLYDLGIIDKKYKMIEGRWTNCYIIEKEAMRFAKTLYEKINS